MTKRLFPLMIAFILGTCFFFTSCNDDDHHDKYDDVTLYDLIKESDDHKILEEAIDEADLEDVFKSHNLINTVFAPTDAAFKKLPAGTLEVLLANPRELLRPILYYHLINSKVTSSDLTNGMILTMVDGLKTKITVDGSMVLINGATITGADINAINGVLHVIDEVLIPPTNTVYEEIAESEALSTLAAAIDAASLEEALSNEDATFTIFAPANGAFDELPSGTVTALLNQVDVLTNFVLYHALGTELYSAQLTDTTLETLNGQDVTITIENGNVFVNDAQVIVADIVCTNGVIHIIDGALIPPAE